MWGARHESDGYALALCCLCGAACSTAPGPEREDAAAEAAAPASSRSSAPADGAPLLGEQDLRAAIRTLWVDQALWTRVVIIDVIAGHPDDVRADTRRLLQGSIDIGDAIKPFHGIAAGNALTALLRDHSLLAIAVVVAGKAGDMTRLSDAEARWYANADQIAAFLAAANPAWPRAGLTAMLDGDLDGTRAEITARLGRGGADDNVEICDARVAGALAMADTLADGIALPFPSGFTPTASRSEDLGRAARMAWEHRRYSRSSSDLPHPVHPSEQR